METKRKAFLTFNTHVLLGSTLPARLRELVILRASWLRGCEYEWIHHTEQGRRAGLTDAEIARITEGPNAPEWSALDAAALQAVDELCRQARISDATWATLAGELSDVQLMDLIFTAGLYETLAMAFNSLGVQLEEGVTGLDEATRRRMLEQNTAAGCAMS